MTSSVTDPSASEEVDPVDEEPRADDARPRRFGRRELLALAEADWRETPGSTPPRLEDLTLALAQLTAWGNLESHPDTA